MASQNNGTLGTIWTLLRMGVLKSLVSSFDNGLLWPLVLDVSRVEGMERLFSKFLRRWLEATSTFSAVNLYSKTLKFPLPISSVVEEFEATKVSVQIFLPHQ